jgi:hypothetical protein
VFRGCFSLASAAAVIVGQHIDPTQVLASVTQLVGKSLLNVEVGDEEVFYRLLDTTRHYALEKLELSGERETLRERHAERYLTLMEQAQTEWEHTPTTQWIERYARGLEDLRAALDWVCTATARALGIRLTATSAALWQELSLLKEYGAHVRQALTLLESAAPTLSAPATALQLALGSACYHTCGGSPETIEAFTQANALAQQHHDVAAQLRAISGHLAVNLSCGHYQAALQQSEQFDRLGGDDPLLSLSIHRLRVLALHFAGDQPRADQRRASDSAYGPQWLSQPLHPRLWRAVRPERGFVDHSRPGAVAAGVSRTGVAHRPAGAGYRRADQSRYVDLLHPGIGQLPDCALQRRRQDCARIVATVAGAGAKALGAAVLSLGTALCAGDR